MEGDDQDQPVKAEGFELVPLAGGINSLRSLENGQTFHPVVGPQREAETVHVAGTRLVERANELAARGLPTVIWDVGLGAAANALAAVRALQAGYRGAELPEINSFDHSVGALEFALENAAALGYPLGYEAELRSLLKRRAAAAVVGQTKLLWRLWPGDFPTVVRTTAPRGVPPAAIFYDPYSPTVNPEMWTLETFAEVLGCTQPQIPCLLTTYTRSTAVRVTLLLAGWHVGIGGATGEKDETTVAANVPGLVERPLPRAWLEGKVYASTNAAPLRAGSGVTRGPISEEDFARLRVHSQFSQGEKSEG